MTRQALAWAAVALLAVSLPAGAAGLQPFTAEFSVKYAGLSVGGSRLQLRHGDRPGQWVLESRADASGLARLLARGTLVQTSWLAIDQDSVRPLRFRFDDGMDSAAEDVDLEFDWAAGRVRGEAKGEAVDIEAPPGLQDPVSIQVATMLALQAGREPGRLSLVEGKRIKTYEYVLLRKERIKTAAGSYDTLVYTSSRPGSDRVTHMWLAPQLGYLAVQVEQYRQDKRLFGMYLDRYRPGD